MNTKRKNAVELFVMLSVAVATATAQEQPTDAETLQRIIADAYSRGRRLELIQPKGERKRIIETGIPQERVTEILENIIRTNVPVLAKLRDEGGLKYFSGGIPEEYGTPQYRACYSLILLQEFSGPDTLALLRESASFRDLLVPHTAIYTYIALEGGNSVPFLTEMIEKKIIGNSRLAQYLRGVLPDLKKQGRDEDIHKFHAFMLEQLQTEPSWNSVEQLDATLCLTLDGYAQSIQRKQAIERFANTEDNTMARERYRKLQGAVDNILDEARTDLSGRFKSSDGIPAVEKSSDGIPAVEKSGGGFQPLEATGTPQRQDAVAPPPNRPWLCLTIFALAVIILGGAAVWRKVRLK
jgi:hypothetical protein